jgi:ABC-type Fe3+-hydroxamate transport system substrate-binding protein
LDQEINADDVKVIEKIINKDDGYTLEKYPFADANWDGYVTNDDITIVNKIINKESTTVYHLNYYNDGEVHVKTKVVTTKYPAEGLMVTYNSCMFMLTILGLDDKVVGSTAVGSTYLDKYMYAKILEGADPLTTSYDASYNTSLDISSVTAVMDKFPTAHTVFASGYSNYDTYNENDVEAVGCDVVRVCESNASRDESQASVLLMGFLCNKMDRAKEVVKLYDKMWDAAESVSKKIAEDKKVGFAVCASSTKTAAGTSNQHNYKCVIAGGKSIVGKDSQTIGTWILEDQYNKKLDKIIYICWSNGGNGYFFGNHEIKSDKLIKDFTESYPTWTMTDAWKNKEVYFVYGDFPIAMNILARGYAMYPDEYEKVYKDSCDELLSFISNGDFSGKGLKFVYSLSEMENY